MDLQSLIGTVLGPPALLWALGSFRTSRAYRALRSRLGRGAARLGSLISRVGNKRLPALWEPLEAVLVDYLLFLAEQFAVGLRRDNRAKLEAQVKRLEGVGSENRIAAVQGAIRACDKIDKEEIHA